MGKSAKGSAFERLICTRLSLWWSDGENDAIFWRTSQSGGRATTRRKKDKDTFGQAGDIAAVDPIGQPLMRMFAMELKRGYSGFSPFDVVDRAKGMKPQTFETWVRQASRSSVESKSVSWLIIFKRDRRQAMAAMPYSTWEAIGMASGMLPTCCTLQWEVESGPDVELVIMPLETMLQATSPLIIKKYLQSRGK
jgi:hypothetical protein